MEFLTKPYYQMTIIDSLKTCVMIIFISTIIYLIIINIKPRC